MCDHREFSGHLFGMLDRDQRTTITIDPNNNDKYEVVQFKKRNNRFFSSKCTMSTTASVSSSSLVPSLDNYIYCNSDMHNLQHTNIQCRMNSRGRRENKSNKFLCSSK